MHVQCSLVFWIREARQRRLTDEEVKNWSPNKLEWASKKRGSDYKPLRQYEQRNITRNTRPHTRTILLLVLFIQSVAFPARWRRTHAWMRIYIYEWLKYGCLKKHARVQGQKLVLVEARVSFNRADLVVLVTFSESGLLFTNSWRKASSIDWSMAARSRSILGFWPLDEVVRTIKKSQQSKVCFELNVTKSNYDLWIRSFYGCFFFSI